MSTVDRVATLHVCMLIPLLQPLLAYVCTWQVWDADKRYCTHNFRGHTGVVVRVDFVPDAKRLQLVSCCEDNSIRIWSLLTQKCLATLKDHFR